MRPQLTLPMEHIGSSYGGWSVAPHKITSDSVVYSFGVGEDISFDLGMISQFGVTVHAFDPTPRSIAWLHAQTTPIGFRFHEYGIANYDGVARFFPPDNRTFVSYSAVHRGSLATGLVDAPVRRLSSIMQQLGHEHIDVLKMDIEGSEYDVIEDVLRSNVSVNQLLVEFHHFMPSIPLRRTREALLSLRAAGFELFSVSSSEREYSFIHRSALRD